MGIPKPTGPFQVGCCDIMTKAKSIPVDVQPTWLCAQYTDLGVFMTLYYPCKMDLDEKKFEKAPWIPTMHTNWYCNGLAVNNLKTSWFSFVIKYCQSKYNLSIYFLGSDANSRYSQSQTQNLQKGYHFSKLAIPFKSYFGVKKDLLLITVKQNCEHYPG